MIKVMLAEDQELIRQSLSIILSSKDGIEVVAEASDGKQAVELAEKYSPDVILLDIRMPGMDGVTACRIISEKMPKSKIIVLTTFDDDEYVFDAIRYGASGYLLKGISVEELVSAIKTVYGGGTLLNPAVASKLVAFFSNMANSKVTGKPSEKHEEIRELNRTENSIVELIRQGLSNKEIASALYLSEGTVRNNISSILSKLNLRDRTQIAIYSINKDIFNEDQK